MLSELENLHHVRVVHLRDELRLVDEHRLEFGVEPELLTYELDCDTHLESAGPGPASEPNGRKTAGPELSQKLVRSEAVSRGERHPYEVSLLSCRETRRPQGATRMYNCVFEFHLQDAPPPRYLRC